MRKPCGSTLRLAWLDSVGHYSFNNNNYYNHSIKRPGISTFCYDSIQFRFLN